MNTKVQTTKINSWQSQTLRANIESKILFTDINHQHIIIRFIPKYNLFNKFTKSSHRAINQLNHRPSVILNRIQLSEKNTLLKKWNRFKMATPQLIRMRSAWFISRQSWKLIHNTARGGRRECVATIQAGAIAGRD